MTILHLYSRRLVLAVRRAAIGIQVAPMTISIKYLVIWDAIAPVVALGGIYQILKLHLQLPLPCLYTRGIQLAPGLKMMRLLCVLMRLNIVGR